MSVEIQMTESQLPADLTTQTLGSNYGLDGFEDQQYGMGVLEGIKDPEYLPAPALPTGLGHEASGSLDLKDFIVEEPLTDLSWLENIEQDPERLPERPVIIPELQEAWSANREAHIADHRTDLDVHRARGEMGEARVAAIDLAEIGRRAIRRVASGAARDTVAREAALSAGGDVSRVARFVAAAEADRGLSGTVYVRIAGFPGHGTGCWKDFLSRHASGARYILADEGTIRAAAWVREGRCTITGKHVVSSIPWRDAYRYYAPRLAAAGYEVPTNGDLRSRIRAAFLKGRIAEKVERVHEIHHGEVSHLGSERFDETAASSAIAERQVSKVAAKVEGIRKLIARGGRGSLLREKIARTFLPDERAVAVRLLAADLSGGVLDDHRPAARMAADTGHRLSVARPQPAEWSGSRIVSAATASLVGWARRAMSEGLAGVRLDDALTHRFTAELLDESAANVRRVRAIHEGLAGHMYVDANAYASPAGVTGCEAGALKHRANGLRMLLAMDRCATCAVAQTLPDGSRRCTTYGKVLITAADVDPVAARKVKAAAIKAASMTDAESTASLFAPRYDPGEFGRLHNAAADELEPMPDGEKMAAVVFRDTFTPSDG